LSRTKTGIANPKLAEIQHADLVEYGSIVSRLECFDACFFCLGISSVRLKEADDARLTYDIRLAAAKTLCWVNSEMVFIYVSGAGTDSSERGRAMWARETERTENAILALPFRSAYMFRPSLIRPVMAGC
jgi:uncharacterized protein YbjT (DUF2867 family)